VESGDHQLAQVSLQYSQGNTIQMTLSNWGQPVQVNKPAAS
jgi:lipoprotein LprG